MHDSMRFFPNPSEANKPPLLYVLLVDDNQLNRALVKRYITLHLNRQHINKDEIEFHDANNGKTAVEIVNRRLHAGEAHYDIIIMDLNMGKTEEENGLFATKTIRQLENEVALENPAYIIRYSTEKPEPSEDELAEQGFNAKLNKVRTTQADVDAVLKTALQHHPRFNHQNNNPEHSN